jgi:hypothetical protein
MAARTDLDGIDWSLTTWEGARRAQLRRWSEMPLEDQIRAVESGMALMEHFRDFVHPRAASKAKNS